MCGIAGIWRLDGPQQGDGERIARMAASLVHRGPDDFGYLLASSLQGRARAGRETTADFLPDVLLASRRLSILDLSPSGRQPIANESGDIFVVFNGAIHNYIELRAELKKLGHVFQTQTDTEVIVHAYEEWGPDCARRFNGMWAYAIWDKKAEQLVCSRDRFGMKPLLVAWRGNSFYFASEAKAIFTTGEVRAEPDMAFVRRFLGVQLPAGGRQTAFEGVEQVLPGHNLIITRQGRRESAYWSYGEQSEEYDFERPEESFCHLLADSMRLRTRSDVPIALLLSGGLDSSAIAAYAPQFAGDELEAFAFSLPGSGDNEMPYAELAAKRCGVRLSCVELDPASLMDDLASATWHMDEPVAQGQVIARWHLLQAAGQKARIVFEGQGADEMLGGYPEMYRKPYLQSEMARISFSNCHRILPRIGSAYFGLGTPSKRSPVRAIKRALKLDTTMPSPWRGVLSPDIAAEKRAGSEWEECGFRFPDHLTSALYRDHAFAVLPYLLHLGDAISMAHSVESRLPFLDHRLVEFIFALPFDMKIRGRETKFILRRALADKLPPRITRRAKSGFPTPLRAWLEPNFQTEVRPRLTSDRVRERGVFGSEGLARCLTDYENKKEDSEIVILRCLALESWFELFIDRNWHKN